MSRAVMQQALEALESIYDDKRIMVPREQDKAMNTAIDALCAALAEPEQEPVKQMNCDTVIALAREANIGTYINLDSHLVGNHLERFAALVAAHEREECAKVCDARYMGDNNREDMEAKRCAATIRSRA